MSNWSSISIRTIGKWTRREVACTSETILPMLEEAFQSCVFGNDEPPLIRMGKGFQETFQARIVATGGRWGYGLDHFRSLKSNLIVDERLNSWAAQIFVWDRESYELPILFVGATVELRDGQ